MSFASDAKEEIARADCTRMNCAMSELSAALSGARAVQGMNPATYRVRVSAGSARIIRRYFNFLKVFLGATAELRTTRTQALGGRTRYHLVLGREDVMGLLEATGLYDARAPFGLPPVPDEGMFASEEARAAFLRGAFLMCGTVTNPEKKYHLEIAAPGDDYANRIVTLMNGFGFSPGLTTRRSNPVVYLKRAEEISDLLTLLGAGGAMLKLENLRIQKEVRGQINRQINCDQSNIERAVQAAQSQADDIRYLDEQIGLEKLPEPLAVIARLRLEHPDASYSELGDLCEPPVGKSGARGRMAKISELATRLKNGEDTGL